MGRFFIFNIGFSYLVYRNLFIPEHTEETLKKCLKIAKIKLGLINKTHPENRI